MSRDSQPRGSEREAIRVDETGVEVSLSAFRPKDLAPGDHVGIEYRRRRLRRTGKVFLTVNGRRYRPGWIWDRLRDLRLT